MSIIRSTGAVVLAALGLLVGSTSAGAQPVSTPGGPSATVCSGPLASGTYSGLLVQGMCTVPDGAMVTITGDLVVSPGSNFDAENYATVTITGNVRVGPAANFGLGQDEEGPSADVVRGSILADHPFALQILGSTIFGSIIVTGGQAVTCQPSPDTARGGAPANLPIKDNNIHGSVTISGWSGCWFGFIRNTVHGAVSISGTDADGYQEFLGFNDSTEVVTNQIWGALACYDNTPAAHVGDSEGEDNLVRGAALGECATLSAS
jgi:hypothetical protein